ncbi:hypothetical protein ACSBR1_004130 [Camellia fascicularis]
MDSGEHGPEALVDSGVAYRRGFNIGHDNSEVKTVVEETHWGRFNSDMDLLGAQEATSSNSRCSYHVFLSFRGEDTRKTFTDYLYTALVHTRFHTFKDDNDIERGENIKFELQKAIQGSRISIVVFSKDYASSSWCLDELVMIPKRRKTTRHVVLPIFYHIDPSHVRKQMGSFKEAFT